MWNKALLYLTSVFSYNLDFTSSATRPCKILNFNHKLNSLSRFATLRAILNLFSFFYTPCILVNLLVIQINRIRSEIKWWDTKDNYVIS